MESYTCKVIPTTGIQLIYDLLRKNYHTQGIIYTDDYTDTARISRVFDNPNVPHVRRVLYNNADTLTVKIEFDNGNELFIVEINAVDFLKDPPKYQKSANYILTCYELIERTESGIRTLWHRNMQQPYGIILEDILQKTSVTCEADNINGAYEDSLDTEFPELDDYLASLKIDNK